MKTVYISGEISNFISYNRSGHYYFTLKDSQSQLKCVMFYSQNESLKFEPKDGMNVLCKGRISTYERDGIYQLYVEDMQPEGIGALSVAFEQLKSKLASAGLFDESHKRPLPLYPQKIGVVTSEHGAVIHDISKVLARRFPIAEIIFYPSSVQGDGSVDEIISGIEKLNSLGNIDVIILGRGGGSIEDLWSFNSEKLAHSIFKSKVPIISAVGHESDFTICDFVADMRAPTPSAAAEIAVPDLYSLLVYIASLQNRIEKTAALLIERQQYLLNSLSLDNMIKARTSYVLQENERVKRLNSHIKSLAMQKVEIYNYQLFSLMKSLNVLNPMAVLSRGYSAAYNNDGQLIMSVNGVEIDEKINVKMNDGILKCSILEIKR